KNNEVRQWVKKAAVGLSIKAGIILGGSMLVFTITGEAIDLFDGGGNGYNSGDFTTAGGVSIWGCELTEDEFVDAVEQYTSKVSASVRDYYEMNMVPYADEFYNICADYNINPCIVFAHGCMESAHGSTTDCRDNKNYFGMGFYNTASSGESYSSYEDSIKDYCEWIKNATTEGTSLNNLNSERAEEFSSDNAKFSDSNSIYFVYCTYEYLGDTHLCDEPDFDNPLGTYPTGTAGGRYYIYNMYELGGLHTGRYKELCGHPNADDPTTNRERADFSEDRTNLRIKKAKNIFGNDCFGSQEINIVDGEAGDAQQKIIEVALNCSDYNISTVNLECQKWVADVYNVAFGDRPSRCCAIKAGYDWGVSKNWSTIQIGATVYGYANNRYGHVGIYVGNGIVAHNIGYVDKISLTDWVTKYDGTCWGWNGGKDLTGGNYPVASSALMNNCTCP
ncbi:MAG: glucosaminidase domain-containing protein, partial [Clostridia bacterium]|nr:glucosaminidase domain-containing protein [Clostridia bacterium]